MVLSDVFAVRLWKTLQDRLPAELRLLEIKSIEEANIVLPEPFACYNPKYSARPAEDETSCMPLSRTHVISTGVLKYISRSANCQLLAAKPHYNISKTVKFINRHISG
jgi:hypothetical protein